MPRDFDGPSLSRPAFSVAPVKERHAYSEKAIYSNNVCDRHNKVAQLSQRDRAAGWVSYGQK